jgi:hypothetical protein
MELDDDDRRVSLFLLLSQTIKIGVFSCCEWQRSKQESHVRQELFVVDPWHLEFIRMNLSVPPFLAHLCRRLIVKYLEYDRRERKSMRSISDEHETRGLDWFGPFRE